MTVFRGLDLELLLRGGATNRRDARGSACGNSYWIPSLGFGDRQLKLWDLNEDERIHIVKDDQGDNMREPTSDISNEGESGRTSNEDRSVISLAEEREFRHGEISWLAPAVIVGTLVLFVALGIALVLVLGPEA